MIICSSLEEENCIGLRDSWERESKDVEVEGGKRSSKIEAVVDVIVLLF
jgi:hypothetical protein